MIQEIKNEIMQKMLSVLDNFQLEQLSEMLDFKNQRQNAVIEQVLLMDPCIGFGDDRLHTQTHWQHGRMLPAGTLSVVLPAHDDAVPHAAGPVHKVRIGIAEGILRKFRNVGDVL